MHKQMHIELAAQIAPLLIPHWSQKAGSQSNIWGVTKTTRNKASNIYIEALSSSSKQNEDVLQPSSTYKKEEGSKERGSKIKEGREDQ